MAKLTLFLLRIATCAQVIELRQGSREDPQGEGREERLSRERFLLREGPPLAQTFYPSLMTR